MMKSFVFEEKKEAKQNFPCLQFTLFINSLHKNDVATEIKLSRTFVISKTNIKYICVIISSFIRRSFTAQAQMHSRTEVPLYVWLGK